MGVEPTRRHLSIRLIGFEDRGRHQPSNAYHVYPNRFPKLTTRRNRIFHKNLQQTIGGEDREPEAHRVEPTRRHLSVVFKIGPHQL